MSGSIENDSSYRSGGDLDCEGSTASSHESELPDTRTPRRNKQIKGMAWILRGEITTTLLHNHSASMDCDDDEEAKIQNTRSQTEAALGATFQILFGEMHAHVKYFIFFCNLVDILRFESGVFSNWDNPLLERRSQNYSNPYQLFFPEHGSVFKVACMETKSTKIACLRLVRGYRSRLGASWASATKAGQQTRARKPR
jgi:hypothetical protein